MPQSLTSRTPNGLTNAAPWQTLADAGFLDPSFAHVDFDDFNVYTAGDWTITKVGTGTVAAAAGDGGNILLTTTAGIADAIYMQRPVEGFKLKAGKDTFIKFAGTLADITLPNFMFGLVNTNTAPFTSTDGVSIRKLAGSGALQLAVGVGGVNTFVNFPANCVLVAGVPFELGVHVDSQGNVYGYFNPTTGSNPISAAAAASTQSRGPVAKITTTLPTAVLNPTFALLNSTAAAKTLTVDYLLAATHR